MYINKTISPRRFAPIKPSNMSAGKPETNEFEVMKFTVEVEGTEGIQTVQVKDNDNIYMAIPEGSKYTTTIHFQANVPLKDFKYIQIGKKAGITVKKTERILGDFEPREELYSVTFEPDTTPSGFLFRGQCQMTSTYYLEGKEVHAADWIVDIVKK